MQEVAAYYRLAESAVSQRIKAFLVSDLNSAALYQHYAFVIIPVGTKPIQHV